MRRKCAFCFSSENKISGEHVWPNWIRKALRQPPTRVAFHRAGRPPREWRATDMGVRVNDICRPCNHGWMEHIESVTQPILTPAIRGEETELGVSDLDRLAVWALKTAMVVDLMTKAPNSFFTDQERNALRTRAQLLPAEVLGVWMAAVEGVNHVASAIDYRAQYVFTSNPGAIPSLGYCVTLSVGHAAFQVFTIRNFPDLRTVSRPFPEASWTAAQLQLFPQPVGGVRWPPPESLDPERYSAFIDRWRPNG
jgi:hypothetical protein